MKNNTSQEEKGQALAIIDIFEHNEFRNLLHLRLEFVKATYAESTEWLARKLLMQRLVNIDQQQDNFDLSEQHECDIGKINTIKQSLLALRQTNNEELERIKLEQMQQLESLRTGKDQEIDQLKADFKEQIAELNQEMDSTVDDFRSQIEDLKS